MAIAQGHRASEDALAEQCSGLLFCDTEAIITKLYAQLFLNFVPPKIEAYAAEDRYALYLVTAATEDWVPDPQRYQPEYAARAAFSRACIAELERLGRRYVLLEGSWEQRTAQAVAAGERPGRAVANRAGADEMAFHEVDLRRSPLRIAGMAVGQQR